VVHGLSLEATIAMSYHDTGNDLSGNGSNGRTIDVKNVFNVFLNFGHVFYVFKRFFYFPNVFLFLKNVGKVQSGNQINKKHFQNNSNEIDL